MQETYKQVNNVRFFTYSCFIILEHNKNFPFSIVEKNFKSALESYKQKRKNLFYENSFVFIFECFLSR